MLYNYKATVISVYDGDTITVDVDLGFNISTRLTLRIINTFGYFDTPEIRRSTKVTEEQKEHGLIATLRAKELLVENSTIYIKTSKDDKYGRWLAEVVLSDGRNYAEVMISEGFQKKEEYN